jgi:hypothetical protein
MLEFPGRMWLRWEMRGGHCSWDMSINSERWFWLRMKVEAGRESNNVHQTI